LSERKNIVLQWKFKSNSVLTTTEMWDVKGHILKVKKRSHWEVPYIFVSLIIMKFFDALEIVFESYSYVTAYGVILLYVSQHDSSYICLLCFSNQL
jgi:hypothetical protein